MLPIIINGLQYAVKNLLNTVCIYPKIPPPAGNEIPNLYNKKLNVNKKNAVNKSITLIFDLLYTPNNLDLLIGYFLRYAPII